MSMTGTGTVPAAVQTYFRRKLLRRALPKTLHGMMAQRSALPKREGNTMKFRRMEALPLPTSPLVEGQAPTPNTLSHSSVTCTLQQWGAYVTLTDVVQWTVEHDLLHDTTKLQGEQSGQTMDVLMREVQCAGTNVLYGGGVASRSLLVTTTEKVTTALLDRMDRALQNNNASMYTEMISASTKISTEPIRDAWWAITHPDVIFTLQTLSGYISAEKYASTGSVVKGEVGAYKNFRFLSTTFSKKHAGGGGTASGDVKSTGGLADVYTILGFGTDAIGYVPLDQHSLENFMNEPGSGDDPLHQRSTMGWKHMGARVRLDESFMIRGEVTAGNVSP